ncbi:MAG: hypothetical protein HQM08_17460 [Candidatus Riflebacteria bacterium]|nr:hypothetical protein [Candidatus Riflebacteria bacterium]
MKRFILLAIITIFLTLPGVSTAQSLVRPIYTDASGTNHQLAGPDGILKVAVASSGSGVSDIRMASETVGLISAINAIVTAIVGTPSVKLNAESAGLKEAIASVTQAVKSPPSEYSSGYLLVGSISVVISPIANQKTIRITRIGADAATWPIYLERGLIATISQSLEFWSNISRDWGPASIAVISSTTDLIYYELEAQP